MKTLLLVVLVLAGILAAGWWLLPLLLAHVPALLGLAGVVLLLVALCLPGKPSCQGFHCSGCRHH